MANKQTVEEYQESIRKAKENKAEKMNYTEMLTYLTGQEFTPVDVYSPKDRQRRIQAYNQDRQNRINSIDVSKSLSPLDRAYAPVRYIGDMSYQDIMDNEKFSKLYDKEYKKRNETSSSATSNTNKITSTNPIVNSNIGNQTNKLTSQNPTNTTMGYVETPTGQKNIAINSPIDTSTNYNYMPRTTETNVGNGEKKKNFVEGYIDDLTTGWDDYSLGGKAVKLGSLIPSSYAISKIPYVGDAYSGILNTLPNLANGTLNILDGATGKDDNSLVKKAINWGKENTRDAQKYLNEEYNSQDSAVNELDSGARKTVNQITQSITPRVATQIMTGGSTGAGRIAQFLADTGQHGYNASQMGVSDEKATMYGLKEAGINQLTSGKRFGGGSIKAILGESAVDSIASNVGDLVLDKIYDEEPKLGAKDLKDFAIKTGGDFAVESLIGGALHGGGKLKDFANNRAKETNISKVDDNIPKIVAEQGIDETSIDYKAWREQILQEKSQAYEVAKANVDNLKAKVSRYAVENGITLEEAKAIFKDEIDTVFADAKNKRADYNNYLNLDESKLITNASSQKFNDFPGEVDPNQPISYYAYDTKNPVENPNTTEYLTPEQRKKIFQMERKEQEMLDEIEQYNFLERNKNQGLEYDDYLSPEQRKAQFLAGKNTKLLTAPESANAPLLNDPSIDNTRWLNEPTREWEYYNGTSSRATDSTPYLSPEERKKIFQMERKAQFSTDKPIEEFKVDNTTYRDYLTPEQRKNEFNAHKQRMEIFNNDNYTKSIAAPEIKNYPLLKDPTVNNARLLPEGNPYALNTTEDILNNPIGEGTLFNGQAPTEYQRLMQEITSKNPLINEMLKKKQGFGELNSGDAYDEMAMTVFDNGGGYDEIDDWTGFEFTERPKEVSQASPEIQNNIIPQKEVVDELDDWSSFEPKPNNTNTGSNDFTKYEGETKDSKFATDTYQKVEKEKRISDKVKFTEKNTSSILDKAKTWYTRLVDTKNPIKKNASETTYQKATNTSYTDGIIGNIIDKELSTRDGKKLGKSVRELFSDIPKEKYDDFIEFLYQRHNIDRAKVEKNVDFRFDAKESAEIVENLKAKNPEFENKANEIVKWIDDFTAEWGVNAGLIDVKTYNNFRKMYPNYIPTNRIFGDNDIRNPFGSFSEKYVDVSSPFKRATGSNKDLVHPVENIIMMVDRTVKTAKFNEVGLSFLNDVETGKVGDIARVVEGDIPTNRDNIVTVIRDGKKVAIEIDDDEVLKSLENLYKNSDGDIARNLRKVTNVFKSLITEYNPFFAVFNGFRDMQNYFINTTASNPLKSLWNLADSYAEVFGLKGAKAEDLAQFKRLGGGGTNLSAKNNSSKIAQNIINGKKPSKLNPLNAIQSFNNNIETATRLAEFKNTIQNGGSVEAAMYNAGDITTNFARNGDITKTIDAGVPFLNAGVQGVDKFFRQIKKHPLQTTARGLTYMTAPTMVNYMLNRDDEDYQDLSNRNKDTYYNIPIGDGEFLKLPKSRDYGTLFSAIPERIMRSIDGDPNAFKGLGGTLVDNFAPSNPLENNIFSTYINLKRNKDFANRTIVPESMQNLEPRYQYDEKTSEISKFIGDKINYSPKKLDYIIDNTTGVVGDIILPATTGDNGLKNVFDKIVKNRFVADTVYSNQPTADFYDNKNELTSRYNTNRFLEKNNMPLDRREQETIKNLNSEYTKLGEEISDLNSAIRLETDEEKIRRLKAQMINKIKRLNNIYENYKSKK